jgi:hypothetical protein
MGGKVRGSNAGRDAGPQALISKSMEALEG